MCGKKKGTSYAALFFSADENEMRAMYVSTPPPPWLDDQDLSKIVVGEAGIYCLYFLMDSEPGGYAQLTVNGRGIRGSMTEEEDGEICGSAICSIREKALPCTLAVSGGNGAGSGIFLVMDYEV